MATLHYHTTSLYQSYTKFNYAFFLDSVSWPIFHSIQFASKYLIEWNADFE